MTVHTITRDPKIQLAYQYTQHQNNDNHNCGVVFLPGFKSDMMGSKAEFLDIWCRDQSLDYLRFDYSGHGQSQGAFTDGTIGSWYADSVHIIENTIQKPSVLVGSSMGGWVSLLVAVRRPDLVSGLVLIAPAPDFTDEIEAQLKENGTWSQMSEQGFVETPSGYDEPYIFTHDLIMNGKDHLLLNDTISYEGAVRILQGKKDTSVPWQKANKIEELLTSKDVEIDFIEDGDHSLSREEDLNVLARRVGELAIKK